MLLNVRIVRYSHSIAHHCVRRVTISTRRRHRRLRRQPMLRFALFVLLCDVWTAMKQFYHPRRRAHHTKCERAQVCVQDTSCSLLIARIVRGTDHAAHTTARTLVLYDMFACAYETTFTACVIDVHIRCTTNKSACKRQEPHDFNVAFMSCRAVSHGSHEKCYARRQ